MSSELAPQGNSRLADQQATATVNYTHTHTHGILAAYVILKKTLDSLEREALACSYSWTVSAVKCAEGKNY